MRLIALQFVPPRHDDKLFAALNTATFARGGASWGWYLPLATLQMTVAPRERVSYFSEQIGGRVLTRLHERDLDKTPFAYLQPPRYVEERAVCELSLNAAPAKVLHALLAEKLKEEFPTEGKYKMLPLVTAPIPLFLTFRRGDEESIFMSDREQDEEPVPLLLRSVSEPPLEAVVHLLPSAAMA